MTWVMKGKTLWGGVGVVVVRRPIMELALLSSLSSVEKKGEGNGEKKNQG